MSGRRIVVEALIPAPVELVWERSQEPGLHLRWDIRFTDIRYRDERDERGYRILDYRTRIGLGVEVQGIGRYLHSDPPHRSTFEFDSDDWKSLIANGRGIWLYEARPDGTYFKTVYDYDSRHGPVGRLLDRLFFRQLLRLATEWSFETLRQWCAGDESAPGRRGLRWRFLAFFAARLAGRPAPPGAARSWLGTGNVSESDQFLSP